MPEKVGVILSGCGVLDGTEIREAVMCLLALDQEGLASECIAPDRPQASVFDHLRKSPVPSEKRNVLVESARIARGNIVAASKARGDDYDALVFPGGFGAAKNLCDFADKGPDCTIEPEILRLIGEARKARRPLFFCCIAPVLGARALQKGAVKGVNLTVGPGGGEAQAIASLGQKHVKAGPTECVVDEENLVVSTPAYMCGDARLADIFTGIQKGVKATVRLARLVRA